jgi:hypothetical protein
MTTPRREITVRRFTSHEEADKADLAYWQQLSPAERVALVWQLSLEQHRLRGDPPYESGLHRSVARVHRR